MKYFDKRRIIPVFRKTLRAILRPVILIFYRLDVVGAHNLPQSGPGMIISNHLSYVDALIIGMAVPRPVRFLMARKYYDMPGLGFFCRLFGTIPVEQSASPMALRKSLDAMVAALKQGELVCIFPEGGLSRTAQIRGFKRGFELVARQANAPIIPTHLDRLWGSIFSYSQRRFFFKRPQNLRRSVTVSFGAPLPPDAGCAQVRQAVMALGAVAFGLRKRFQQPLHVQFWRRARKLWWRKCMADTTGTELTWGRALVGSLALSRWMRRQCHDQKMVGMMMPASCGAALVNVAALLAGKVPVNLNFLGARTSIDVSAHRCRLRTIFTTHALLKRVSLPERPEFVYLEEVLASLPKREKIISGLLAILTPTALATRFFAHHGHMNDLATVMFTSGSTGKPKGVMLTHSNIMSNIEQCSEVLHFGRADTMVGVLPLFHSFGFTATLWAPLTCGMRVVFHSNPLDAKAVGALVAKYRGTILVGTPTFYSVYTRGCDAEQFRSLRLAIAGGQKLMPSIAQSFKEKFGLPLNEGYGCTELSPVVAVNVPDVHYDNEVQYGTRAGSVGRPLPGLAIRIVHRDTMSPIAEDATGIILVKGATVMRGYMDDAEATTDAIRDDAYVTADIGTMDDDGFLFVHDRISRFSKIGGEMVPHGAVEEALERLTQGSPWRFAVVSVPDRMRGEKLAVVYSGPEADPPALLKAMAESGIPNLWLPGEKDFIRVEALPLLPTGKTDFVAARRMATETNGAAAGADK